MGFFKDLGRVRSKSKEMEQTMPGAKERLAQGQASIESMNQMLAGMNAAHDPSQPSTTLDAQVVAVRDVGAQINLQPVLEVDLLVFGPAGATVPVRVRVDDPQQVCLIV